MGKATEQGRDGSGESAFRASAQSLSRLVPATQAEINSAPSLPIEQARALVARVLHSPGLDYRPLLSLPPVTMAALISTDEWRLLLDSMIGFATIDKEDRYTKSQWRALGFQRRQAAIEFDKRKRRSRYVTDESDPGIIDVTGNEAEA